MKEFTTDEMVRVICEEQPPRPSEKASGTLDSDIDAIVLKALRKEPKERYASVDQLIADLQAYLDGRPVAARQGNFRYHAVKLHQRSDYHRQPGFGRLSVILVIERFNLSAIPPFLFVAP